MFRDIKVTRQHAADQAARMRPVDPRKPENVAQRGLNHLPFHKAISINKRPWARPTSIRQSLRPRALFLPVLNVPLPSASPLSPRSMGIKFREPCSYLASSAGPRTPQLERELPLAGLGTNTSVSLVPDDLHPPANGGFQFQFQQFISSGECSAVETATTQGVVSLASLVDDLELEQSPPPSPQVFTPEPCSEVVFQFELLKSAGGTFQALPTAPIPTVVAPGPLYRKNFFTKHQREIIARAFPAPDGVVKISLEKIREACYSNGEGFGEIWEILVKDKNGDQHKACNTLRGVVRNHLKTAILPIVPPKLTCRLAQKVVEAPPLPIQIPATPKGIMPNHHRTTVRKLFSRDQPLTQSTVEKFAREDREGFKKVFEEMMEERGGSIRKVVASILGSIRRVAKPDTNEK